VVADGSFSRRVILVNAARETADAANSHPWPRPSSSVEKKCLRWFWFWFWPTQVKSISI